MNTITIICGFCGNKATLYHRPDIQGYELAAHRREWMTSRGWDASSTLGAERPNVWRCDNCKNNGIGEDFDNCIGGLMQNGQLIRARRGKDGRLVLDNPKH